jgi:hypothetical protein
VERPLDAPIPDEPLEVGGLAAGVREEPRVGAPRVGVDPAADEIDELRLALGEAPAEGRARRGRSERATEEARHARGEPRAHGEVPTHLASRPERAGDHGRDARMALAHGQGRWSALGGGPRLA